MEQNISTHNYALQVDNGNIPYLAEAAKWAKFLAIIGFITCAFIIVIAFFAGTYMAAIIAQFQLQSAVNMGAISGTLFTVYYLLLALLYFFPCFYLFSFASKTQTAIRNNDQVYINDSFKNLKSFFKFWGILTVIFLCIAVIGIIFSAIFFAGLRH